MCDFSLQAVQSRPARVGDEITTRNFGTGTRGFSAHEDSKTAVCVLPGTEIAFSSHVTVPTFGFFHRWRTRTIDHTTAIFRQVDKDNPQAHHDALEFPDGQIILLTLLSEGQKATVLQLPAQPTTLADEAAQKRVAYTG